jgi:glutaredoxin 3
MSEIVMYSSGYCPYCMRARNVLDAKNVRYKVIDVDREPGQRAEMRKLSGRTSVPQIWIGERHVGGFDDLWALESSGELNQLIIIGS